MKLQGRHHHRKDHGHATETPDTSYIQNPDVAHEESDVNVRSIAMFVVGLVIFFGVTFLLIWLMMKFFDEREARLEPPPGPMALTEQERLPPEPRLQLAPGFGVDAGNNQRANLELKAPQDERRIVFHQWEEELKNGRRDPNTGQIISIPIAEAMRKLVEENPPPARQPASGKEMPAQGGMDVPAFMSSGRQTEKRDP
jgi:hypothetical protein